jgi:hypothetical protein
MNLFEGSIRQNEPTRAEKFSVVDLDPGGSVRIILADPDHGDRHPGPADPDPNQPNVRLNYTFISRKHQYRPKYRKLRHFDTYEYVADEKDKTMKTGTAVIKNKNKIFKVA